MDKTKDERPLIAVPLGDPAGIGPEIAVRAALCEQVRQKARVVLVGDTGVVARALSLCGTSAEINALTSPREGEYAHGALNCVEVQSLGAQSFTSGVISAACGKAAYDYIERACALAMSGEVAAVATPPINKEALKAAGVPYIGHTEIFGALTGTRDPLTMFEVRNLRIFFLTRHVSLRQAIGLVTKPRIEDYVKRCAAALGQLGVAGGTMAVAGLNPHSGEHGLFGDEEEREIAPAVEALNAQGYAVAGPIGADSVFHMALQGRFNSVLSLYHDQGHIAAKTLDFERTVSLTLGMPILRTSVDHGTAMDIAGTGKASAVSMVEAILVAAKYARQPHD